MIEFHGRGYHGDGKDGDVDGDDDDGDGGLHVDDDNICPGWRCPRVRRGRVNSPKEPSASSNLSLLRHDDHDS